MRSRVDAQFPFPPHMPRVLPEWQKGKTDSCIRITYTTFKSGNTLQVLWGRGQRAKSLMSARPLDGTVMAQCKASTKGCLPYDCRPHSDYPTRHHLSAVQPLLDAQRPCRTAPVQSPSPPPRTAEPPCARTWPTGPPAPAAAAGRQTRAACPAAGTPRTCRTLTYG